MAMTRGSVVRMPVGGMAASGEAGRGTMVRGSAVSGTMKNIDLLKGRRRDDGLRPEMSHMTGVLRRKSAE